MNLLTDYSCFIYTLLTSCIQKYCTTINGPDRGQLVTERGLAHSIPSAL